MLPERSRWGWIGDRCCARVAALVILVGFPVGIAAAQPATTRGDAPRLWFGIGSDLQSWDATPRGLAALLATTLPVGDGPVAARVAATYFTRDRTPGWTEQYGIGVDLSWTAGTGTVQPYVLVGAAAYRVTARPGPASAGGPPELFRRNTVAGTVGGGVAARLGSRLHAFSEVRYTRFGAGDRVRPSYAPILLGLRL